MFTFTRVRATLRAFFRLILRGIAVILILVLILLPIPVTTFLMVFLAPLRKSVPEEVMRKK